MMRVRPKASLYSEFIGRIPDPLNVNDNNSQSYSLLCQYSYFGSVLDESFSHNPACTMLCA